MSKYILSAILLIAPASLAAQEKPIYVNRSEFDCLIRNLDQIPASDRAIFVEMASCPKLKTKKQSHQMPPPPHLNSQKPETWLRVEPSQLRCLKNHRRSPGQLAKVDPARPAIYRLQWNKCNGR